MNEIPVIHVGVQLKECIEFTLHGSYSTSCGVILNGTYKVVYNKDCFEMRNGSEQLTLPLNTQITSSDPEAYFTLHKVVIGINFHWEREEDQSFKGGLKLMHEDGKIWAINFLSLDDYLLSVISSEMSATSSLELLKAHAVISRSWLLAQIEKNVSLTDSKTNYQSINRTETEYIRWYDREDHLHFDVCADDHCQRYQGITKATSENVKAAIESTRGEVLFHNGQICDARFSKCCGGMVESFENVWEPVKHPYLQSFVDNNVEPSDYSLQLQDEQKAEKWISGSPRAFCNTNNREVLSQVLNDYDQETNDFYRWTVRYTQSELSELIKERSEIDFGLIQALIPVLRGHSGRLNKLKIVGSKKELTIGKELEIRKVLSKSHLYSSAFIVEKSELDGQIVFTLKGAGWGHGVGLCQIGAAMMGAEGYDYKAILNHYFRGAELNKKY